MEFVQGSSLREYFNRGTRFAERDVVSILVQLLDTLGHAHDQGVWHRDVKPANLILMTNGRLKIADFGIARIDASHLTHTGVVLGSPGYMAPEQYSGGAVDWRADLFAAGVVMYQLLTGTRPFKGNTEQVAFQICYEQPPAPSTVDPGRGWERYDGIVARALAKKPDERLQSAGEFREAILDAYAAPVSPTVSEDTIIAEPAVPAMFEPSNPSARTDPGATPRPVPLLGPVTEPNPALRGRTRGAGAPHDAPTGGTVIVIGRKWPIVVAGIAVLALAVVAGMLLRPGQAPAPQAAATAPPAKAAPKQEASRAAKPATAPAPKDAPKREVAAAQPPRAAETKSAPAEGGGFWRDQALTHKVQAKLQFSRSLWQSSGGIRATARDGIVTLTGYAPSREDIAEAGRIAAGVSGVREVRNELRVGTPDVAGGPSN